MLKKSNAALVEASRITVKAINFNKQDSTPDGWQKFESVPPVAVVTMLGTVKEVTHDRKVWRKTPDGTGYMWHPANHQQEQAQNDAGTQNIYCSYVCLGAGYKAFKRAFAKYDGKDKSSIWATLSIISAAAHNEKGAWIVSISQKAIANELNKERKAIGRHIKQLVEAGLIFPIGKYIPGQDGRRYQICYQVEEAK